MTLNYLPTGRLEAKAFPNGVTGNYTYFDNGDLQELKYKKADDTSIMKLAYTYDNAHNINGKTLNDSKEYIYGYDNLYQLTGATIPSATSQNENFTYDGVGNRLSSIDKPSWSYDNNNRLTAYNGVSFGYDDHGNTVSKTEGGATENYSYDFENRLISYSSVTASASYKYGSMGRRIEKDVNGTVTRYLWDSNVIIAELDDLNNITKLYTYNPQTSEPVSMTEGTDTYWYLNDHLMTPQKMVDTSGVVAWAAEYKAFGEVAIEPSSTITNNLRFPGQYYDAETELSYNMNRYYWPEIGRYSTPDPILQAFIPRVIGINTPVSNSIWLVKGLLSKPRELNQYLYVRNNSISSADPLGLQGQPAPILPDSPSPGPTFRPPKPECDEPCKPFFHLSLYLSCVGNAITSPGPWVVAGGCLGFSSFFGPLVGAGISIACGGWIGWTIKIACDNYATFCEEEEPGPKPSFN